MSALPPGWHATTMGALGKYLNGRGFKKSEWGPSGRPIIRIQNLTGSSTTFNYFDGQAHEDVVARRGDLLVAWAATLGAYFWQGPEALVNQHIFKVESYIDRRFHKYLLDEMLGEIMTKTHGSGIVHVTRPVFEGLQVAVPDLVSEQRRIVDILEDHLSRLDAAAQTLGTAQLRINAWRRGLVERAIWLDRATASTRRVGELLDEPMRNGHSARAAENEAAGIRTLTLTAVTRNMFVNKFTKMTIADPQRVSSLWLEPGDVLVQRANTPELVGTCALYNGRPDWAIFPDLLIRLRANRGLITPAYLAAAIRSERVHRMLRAKAKGLAGSMPKIDQAAIASIVIPVPSLVDQAMIVNRLDEADQVYERLSSALTATAARGTKLRRALLAAAFSGRLLGRSTDNDVLERLAEANNVRLVQQRETELSGSRSVGSGPLKKRNN